MHIAEVVTIAKSLPLLRLNTYKSLILSYSADYRRIFRKNKYWNIIDECNLGYVGLHCYESDDATNWTDVVVIGDRAFIFYFTHPGRTYKMDGMEVEENTWNYHRASIQIAELEYVDGKIVCDRDKYAKKVPSPIERKKK